MALIFICILVIAVQNVKSASDICAGNDPTVGRTHSMMISGLKHCFFELTNDTSVANHNGDGTFKFNMEATRQQCLEYGARMPQIYTNESFNAFFNERYNIARLNNSDGTTTGAIPLGLTVEEVKGGIIRVLWDDGTRLDMTADELNGFTVPDPFGTPVPRNGMWINPTSSKDDMTIFGLSEWAFRTRPLDGVYSLLILCHQDPSKPVTSPVTSPVTNPVTSPSNQCQASSPSFEVQAMFFIATVFSIVALA